MDDFILVKHAQGAPGFRLLGLGPKLWPQNGVRQLIHLLHENTPWAKTRSLKDTKIMLSKSTVIVSVWKKKNLIGFGRATSDESFRAVLWDIVVDQNYQKLGLGRKIVLAILENSQVSSAERIYLMTTNCETFYTKMGFKLETFQNLMRFSQKDFST